MSRFPVALVGGALLMTAVVATCTQPDPPPVKPPTPPPVSSVSRCTEVFPINDGGYTRPTPTNHPIIILSALPDYSGPKVLWLDRNCGVFYLGPLDYRYPNTDWCEFHPELGDRIYSGQNTFIIPIPAPCTGQNV